MKPQKDPKSPRSPKSSKSLKDPENGQVATAMATPGSIQYLPYGHMWAGLEAAATGGPLPRNFTPNTWVAYFDATLTAIADAIWPRWSPAGWAGQADAAKHALTRADLSLMANGLGALLDSPAGSIGDLPNVTHKMLFTAEDDMPTSGGTFETMRRYMAAAPLPLVNELVTAARAGLTAMGPRPLAFKRQLQRPRPYQVSLWDQGKLSYQLAKSAVTPSIMSGHALQGLFVATWAYIDQKQQVDNLPNGKAALQAFGVDFGDRRVYAGVHYPSDNVASWYIALTLADTCFGGAAGVAKAFMKGAIQSSKVHAHLAGSTDATHQKLMAWFAGAA